MSKTIETGKHAEALACEHLQAQGLTLVAQNVRGPRGELDLIMLDAQMLVFVEVRYRQQTRYGSGAETVSRHKQAKLVTTALYYLQQHPRHADRPARFDVVSITASTNGPQLEWIKDAFQA